MANEKTINARLQQKHDIEAHWKLATNFIPKAGEIIVYDDLNKIKIGDGTTYVNELLFTNGSVGLIIEQGGEIFNDYENNQAAGLYSHAEGCGTESTGNYAHAEGYQTISEDIATHAEGYGTQATGIYSHTEGCETVTNGEASHAEGQKTTAGGIASHAEGFFTNANSDYSHTEGYGTQANNVSSHAEGSYTDASGYSSHAEGDQTNANGDFSHAEGCNTLATGEGAHAEGEATCAEGNLSHAEGSETKAYGLASHAEGSGTTAFGKGSHAEGNDTKAFGNNSHAEGCHTTVGQKGFVIQKCENFRYGTGVMAATAYVDTYLDSIDGIEKYNNAHIFIADDPEYSSRNFWVNSSTINVDNKMITLYGNEDNLKSLLNMDFSTGSNKILYSNDRPLIGTTWRPGADNAHAGGLGTIASADNQTAIGKYNAEDSSALFIVGNGDENTRSNAFAVNKDGSATLAKVGENDNNIATVGYVKENLPPFDEYVKNTDYATHETAGIVQLASDWHIDERSGECAIPADMLEYALIEGLGYPKNDLADEEAKAVIRESLGVVGVADYATKDKGGVVKVNYLYGTQITNGVIGIYSATNSTIDNRIAVGTPWGTADSNCKHAIVPANVDYAVKKVLSDCRVEWTDEEKANARAQLGAAGLDDIINIEYLNAQLNALITVADIDTICGGNIVAASEVTF